ncbi:MAG: hypothetical protein J0L84_01350 [Verrucomicrobia bacterium]|nr:hypothetical protein [Verrucomicrobiota bacterium]
MEWTHDTRANLANNLGQCPRNHLEGWLLELADLDPEMARLLSWRAAALRGDYDAPALRELIHQLTDIPADVSWRASGPVERRIVWLPRLLQTALDCPTATAVPEAVELALWKSEALVMAVQDSEDWSSDLEASLRSLHLEACQRFRPDPRALAQRMARLQRYPGIGWLDPWPAGYEALLGPDGLSEWR